uniref:Uncharacterized protein n=1 Tax=Arundo donax TaxID=35708 RepID=A0A0A9F4U1_ARUDO
MEKTRTTSLLLCGWIGIVGCDHL